MQCYDACITNVALTLSIQKQVARLESELQTQGKELKTERLRRKQAEWKLQQLLARYFAKSSEKIDPDQLLLLLEGIEQSDSSSEPPPESEAPDKEKKRYRNKKTKFPEDLREETIEIALPEEELICPDTGKERKFVRWEETTKINLIPSHFVRLRIRRAVHAVPAAAAGEGDDACLSSRPILTAPMPAEYRVIPGCIAAAGLLSWLMVAKYCDHLPLYRIQNIFKRRHKVDLDRTTMCHWLKRCAEILTVLYNALRLELLSGNYLQIDETFIKLLDPDRKGKAVQSNFWVITEPGKGVLFHFDPSRASDVAADLLNGYQGRLQADGYKAYQTLTRRSPNLELFHCWAHVRRKFVESLEANGADAAWYISEIQRLYRIEKQAREEGNSAEERSQLRGQKSKPILARIKERMDNDEKRKGEILPSSPLGKAIGYTRSLWKGLTNYAEPANGEVEIDNNCVENAIRPTAVGKKNWLFIGHPKAGQMSAIIYTIVENCRMQDLDPLEYLNDVLPRVMDHPANRVAELLPRQWKQARG